MINRDWMYEFKTDDALRTIHDQILAMWKHYKQNEGRFLDMGINMKENESEGRAFDDALKFDKEEDTKEKTEKEKEIEETEEECRPRTLPKSDGSWDKYSSFITPDPAKAKEEKARKERPDKINYYLGIAKAVSARGTCLRRRFGAIVVKDDRVVSSGYVGAPRGRINCCDRGTCFRMENNIPSGQRYELCRSVHAEMNAIINASKEELEGGVMYLVGVEPDGSYTPNADCCSMCKRVIINAGIRYVIIATDRGPKTINVNEWVANDDSLTLHEGY
jgi:dCMP deaminase